MFPLRLSRLLALCSVSLLLFAALPLGAANQYAANFVAASSQYFSIPDASQTGLDINGDFTADTWVYLTQQPANGGAYYTILSKDSNASGGWGYYWAYFQAGGVLQTQVALSPDGINNYGFVWVTTLPLNTWTELTISYKATTHLVDFYKNGVKQTSDNSQVVTSIYNNAISFKVGAMGQGSGAHFYWNGKLDNVRLWSMYRTSTDIIKDYNCYYTAATTSLVGNWLFENNANDNSGNGNNLTNNNSVTFEATTTPTINPCVNLPPTPSAIITAYWWNRFFDVYNGFLVYLAGAGLFFAVIVGIVEVLRKIKPQQPFK